MTDQNFLKNGYKEWPWSSEDAGLAIRNCTDCKSLNQVLENLELSETPEKIKTLRNDLTDWTYPEFICSALNFQFLNTEIAPFGWSIITNILMNPFLSDDVLSFLKKNDFYNQTTKNQIIKGILFSLKYPNFHYRNEKCIKNVLHFIEIEQNDITRLIDNFSIKKDLTIITSYLSSFANK